MAQELGVDREHAADVAIVGMSARFPGSKNIQEFWNNLIGSVESFVPVSDAQANAILDKVDYLNYPHIKRMLRDPNYVKAGAILQDIDLFDAAFFGLNPGEVEVMDPQHRLFLECAWESLENAGYNSETYNGLIGVYGGCASLSKYLFNNIYSHLDLIYSERDFLIITGNENDYLSTRVSYKLNLRGPSFTVQSACSTSLVATHLACQGLLNGECDMALAGGVAILLPQNEGYLYRPGGLVSPDGHCRAFDARANGTTFSHGGVGIVVLKRLADAMSDGDDIYAVIKGSALTNDGSQKAGYSAPGISGQTAAMREAYAVANVAPETISYIETHGTGTALGDAIEINALQQVFRSKTSKKSFCAIGSVKTNIGHAAVAAGIAGLIKTALALKNQKIPPSLYFQKPHPQHELENSPFYVNTEVRQWPTDALPHRAGVSSFGVGGTNAHIVLEQEPTRQVSGDSRPWQLLVLSARTQTALQTMTANLASHLSDHRELNLADVAFTLSLGRKKFNCRRTLVCQDIDDAVRCLRDMDAKRVCSMTEESKDRPVVFMFSGQGAQYVNMGLSLYQHEPKFREQIDTCAHLLRPRLGMDLRQLLYPPQGKESEASTYLTQTFITQPALFVIEYALARLWMEWGIKPEAMIGHSIGEYVAACLAGVFSLEDALSIVAARGSSMQKMPRGSMLAVLLTPNDMEAMLPQGLSLAAHNAPNRCVVSGNSETVDQLEKTLQTKGIECRRLHTSHAFHSQMMEPILDAFLAEVSKVSRKPPQLPYISNLTGTWITAAQATDPTYWTRHLRHTVRFSEGMMELLRDARRVFLEVGPGQTLNTLAKANALGDKTATFASLRHPQEEQSDLSFLLNNLGRMWGAGCNVDWSKFYAGQRRYRVALPTYPFERQRYWIEPIKEPPTGAMPLETAKKNKIADWFYFSSWKRSILPLREETEKLRWLIFCDACGMGTQVAERLRQQGHEVTTVIAGDAFKQLAPFSFSIASAHAQDYDTLLKNLPQLPDRIVHMWSLTHTPYPIAVDEKLDQSQNLGFYSLLSLAQGLGKQNLPDSLPMVIVSNHLYDVTGGEPISPQKATLLGPCKVIPHEYPNITCRNVDIVLPQTEAARSEIVQRLVAELMANSSDMAVCHRGVHRWVQLFEPLPMEANREASILKERGVYLITGGLGGIGMILAEYLAISVHARLILLSRSALPPREEWDRVDSSGKDEASRKIGQIRRLEKLGAEVLVLCADVTNLENMQATMDIVRRQFGKLNGIIHAAGMAGKGLIQLKNPKSAADVLAPKVKGALNLYQTLADSDFDFMIFCSSIFSVTGGMGQVDYCGGNACLDTLSHHWAGRGKNVISINWDGWENVGMTASSNLFARQGKLPQGTELIGHPLLHRCIEESDKREVYSTEFSVARHWVLSDHRMLGNAIVPGTAFLEMVRAAAEISCTRSEAKRKDRGSAENRMIELRDVFFLMPLSVGEDESREARLFITKTGDTASFVIETRGAGSYSREGTAQKHAIGEIAYLDFAPPRKYDIPSLIKECSTITVIDIAQEETPRKKDKPLDFGPHWQNLKRVYVGDCKGLAVLELPDKFCDDLEQFKMHPALMDMANGVVFGHISSSQKHACALFGGEESVFLPLSYKSLKIRDRLPRKIYSYITFKSDLFQENAPPLEIVTYNIVIMNEEGMVLAEVEEFSLKRVKDISVMSQEREKSTPHLTADRSDTASRGDMLREAIDLSTEAILPQEGVETLRRILAHNPSPQIVVTGRDLLSLLKPKQSALSLAMMDSASPTESKAMLPRPNIQTAYVAPRNDLEKTLVAIWQQILGVEQVGIYDNFFELGGDSILGVQIIAKAKRSGVDLSPNQLFQHHTIADLATVLSSTQPGTVPSQDAQTPPHPELRAEPPAKFAESGLSEQELQKFMDQIGEKPEN